MPANFVPQIRYNTKKYNVIMNHRSASPGSFDTITNIIEAGTSLNSAIAAADTYLNTPIFMRYVNTDEEYEDLLNLCEYISDNKVNGRESCIVADLNQGNLFFTVTSVYTRYNNDELVWCNFECSATLGYASSSTNIETRTYRLFIQLDSTGVVTGYIVANKTEAQSI